jgi:phytoene dehydrogenase-like protein
VNRQRDPITIIGGGITGLSAAIVCAERGRPVVLHEATAKLGGRARSTGAPFITNRGPHALYGDGPMYGWLRERKLLPQLVRPVASAFMVRLDGRLTRFPRPLLSAVLRLRGTVPAELDYRTWASQRAGDRVVEAAVGFVSLPTFHHDPGELSAAFCQERFRRIMLQGSKVRYVVGGWSVLVDVLAQRASDLGVEIQMGSRVTALEARPSILALPLSAAGALLADTSLEAGGARTALLDVAISSRRRSPGVVFDLTERVYVSRVSRQDPTLAPCGEDLIQASAGIRPTETIDQARGRIESVIEAGFPGWRRAETWRRFNLAENSSGALDAPGSTWKDRPAIDQGDGIYLAGDAVAAPGLLSEVGFASAIKAADLILEAPSRPRATTSAVR